MHFKDPGNEMYFNDRVIPQISDLTDLDEYRREITEAQEELRRELEELQNRKSEVERQEKNLREKEQEKIKTENGTIQS